MIRNVAIVGHSHSGKTSLSEWMLYDEKVLTKQPLAGQSLLDSDPAESSRHSNANSALDGSDSAVIVASVCDDLKPGTITSFKECQEKNIKSILCLSKMDRPFIDVDNFMDEFEASLGVKPVPLQDIVKNDEPGTEEAWMHLEEAVAMTDDDLLMEYLDDDALAPDKERLPFPNGAKVLPGNVIAVPKLDSVQTNDILTVKEAVSEEAAEIKIEEATQVLTPLSRRAAELPLMYTALVSLPESDGKKGGRGKSNSGSDKLISALQAISREGLAVKVDTVKGSLLLHCMSGDHAQLIATRVKDRYGIDIELSANPVQYKETISKAAINIEGRHKKQSGGSGQFGVCVINMEPLEEGSGVEFVSQIKGGVISKPFIASVEKGVREQLEMGGPLAGYPVSDVRVHTTDEKMHSVDSNDFAFTSAGKLSVKAALSKAGTRLLQPMEEVHFQVSEKMVGEITSIVSRIDGYVMGSESTGVDSVEIEAILPSASIPAVSDALRSKTAGSGTFNNVFAHYQAISDEQTVKQIVDESPYRHE
ncbi:putative ribosome-releasing factor [Skeletonema marinoi]|uniref:Ribosome-releasing factor n=1 Tax=Skeletonema marinoi TaxID=267567 RepID=A0AAD9DHI0_9STRA|nr:putative ribosome-releasing factor [Skeletonema marinoi]